MTRAIEPGAVRAAHPLESELVDGLDLSIPKLDGSEELHRMLSNAEYWLSFGLAEFETLLAKSPSPLRELGVAVALRFSERINGELSWDELQHAKEVVLASARDDQRPGLTAGLTSLERAVQTRDRLSALQDEGFAPYTPTTNLSVRALRAMGKAVITVEGVTEAKRRSTGELGRIIGLSATDERGRALQVPEIESRLDAPLLVRDDEANKRREVVFYVPGEYVLRVPGRVSGDRRVLVR